MQKEMNDILKEFKVLLGEETCRRLLDLSTSKSISIKERILAMQKRWNQLEKQ
jgi:hypothetical protein